MMASLALPEMSGSRMAVRRVTKKPWCARLFVRGSGRLSREFLRAAVEHNARRPCHYFVLPEGAYEVYEPTSPRDGRRYFVISQGGNTREADFAEVMQCLNEC